MKIYLSYAGDRLPSEVQRIVAAGNEAELRKLSSTLRSAAEDLHAWIISIGGSEVSSGEVSRVTLPSDKIGELGAFRGRYEALTGDTLSVGVGMSLEDADAALKIAQKQGGDQAVFWRPELAEEDDSDSNDPLVGIGEPPIVDKLKKAAKGHETAKFLIELQKSLPALVEKAPAAAVSLLNLLDTYAALQKTSAAPKEERPTKKKSTAEKCTCPAYTFPHRRGGGSCKEKETPLAKSSYYDDPKNIKDYVDKEGFAFTVVDRESPEWEWSYVDKYPVSKLTHLLSPGASTDDWRQWFENERQAHAEDGRPDHFDGLLEIWPTRPEEIGPIIIAEDDSGEAFDVGDGWHRMAISHMTGMSDVPAIVGRKKLNKTALVPGNNRRKNLYHMPVQHDREVGYPTGTQISRGRVKIAHSNMEMGRGITIPSDTSWVQMRDGQIMSQDGHPISSRNPNGR